jgi:hypothetical protein
MTTAKVLQCGVLASLLLGLSQVSWAASCAGHDVLVNKSAATMEVAKGHSVTSFTSYSIVTSDYPAFDGTTGECSGLVLTTPDGASRMSGYCARKDKDGDTYSIEFHMAPGAERGAWKWLGGTGKFAGKTNNSGWFQGVINDGNMSMSNWGGNCY